MRRLNEEVFSKKKLIPKFDTTNSEKSLASNVEPLISKMEKMSASEISKEFLAILQDENVHASEKTRNKWKDVISKNKTNKYGLMRAISNLYLAGARMAVESEFFGDGAILLEHDASQYKMKHVKMFEQFAAEADRHVVTLADMFEELHAFIPCPDFIRLAEQTNITTANSKDLELLVRQWGEGAYDDDPALMISKLQSFLQKKKDK